MPDNWEGVLALVAAVFITYAVVLWLGSIVWTYRDIRGRTQDGWSQGIALSLVALFNIPGLFLYLILRPHETLAEAYERRLEAEALMRDTPERMGCPRCERTVKEDFLVCPHCRTSLRDPCLGCGRALELRWSACPYCGADGPRAVAKADAKSALDTAAPPPQGPPPQEAPATDGGARASEPASQPARAATPPTGTTGRASR